MGAAVPKASVHKDGHLTAGVGDIGASGGLFPLQAVAGKACRTQALAHELLGLGIRALVAAHRLFDGGAAAHELLLVARKVAGSHVAQELGLLFALGARLVLFKRDELAYQACVGGHPFQGRERFARHPTELFLPIVGLWLLALGESAEKAFHREMEVVVGELDRIEIAHVAHAHAELLFELALKGRF